MFSIFANTKDYYIALQWIENKDQVQFYQLPKNLPKMHVIVNLIMKTFLYP